MRGTSKILPVEVSRILNISLLPEAVSDGRLEEVSGSDLSVSVPTGEEEFVLSDPEASEPAFWEVESTEDADGAGSCA